MMTITTFAMSSTFRVLEWYGAALVWYLALVSMVMACRRSWSDGWGAPTLRPLRRAPVLEREDGNGRRVGDRLRIRPAS